ncbi:MAG: glycoside hydrolase [Pirellulaceae bacterium]
MRILITCLLAVLCSTAASPGAQPELVEVNRFGQVRSVMYDGEQLALRAELRVPVRGWKQSRSASDGGRVRISDDAGRRAYVGQIEVQPEKRLAFRQTIAQQDREVRITIACRAESDLDIEGVYYWIDAPISEFAGGLARLSQADELIAEVPLPLLRPEQRHLLMKKGSTLQLRGANERVVVTAQFDRPLAVVLQDTREWNGRDYDAYVALHSGPMKQGEEVAAEIRLQITGQPETAPVALTVDASQPRYQLDGFGGNYCFGIESPVTQYTLEELRVAWARTEMTLTDWEPTNDNAAAEDANWSFFKAQDRPGSDLRREFELAAQLQQRGIPYCISIWWLPEWLYTDPGQPRSTQGRRIAPDLWPELLECIGSYLTYAKQQYGVEPDLFSFNEANIGIYVLFSAEEHRDAIQRIGRHLETLGLHTKMLLADATGPSGTHTYALPAANDPQAVQFCGAVGFHSWGGGSPEDYRAWADLADRLKLPLLVTELGVDAGAWRDGSYATYAYAMREMQMYQELLLHARPQGTMHWEFTSDYRITDEQTAADGEITVTPTARFWLIKHFCNLTPPKATALTTHGDSTKVLLTAFVATESAGDLPGAATLTLHLSNIGASRQVTIEGIPDHVTQLRAVLTSDTQSFAELDPVVVSQGKVSLQLQSRCLLTLTTQSR